MSLQEKITDEFDFDADLSIYGFVTHRSIVGELQLLANSMSTHKALALKIGISEQYLSDILKGKRLPGKAVCAFLKVKPVLVYREVK